MIDDMMSKKRIHLVFVSATALKFKEETKNTLGNATVEENTTEHLTSITSSTLKIYHFNK